MTALIIIIAIVLVGQIGLFFFTRKKIKEDKKNSIVEKYNIKNSGDAWRVMNDMTVPEEDREKIQAIYNQEES